MLKILIVEDDLQLATTLKYLVEDNPRYRVVAIADDADNAVAAAEHFDPTLRWSTFILPAEAPASRPQLGLAIMTCPACSSAGRRPISRCPTWRWGA